MSTPDPTGLYERLAAIEHERWSDWQRYLHGLCTTQPDGSLVIPAEQVTRWERQIATPYEDLTEDEKNSDREQVDRYWPLIDPGKAAGPMDQNSYHVDVRVTTRNESDLARFVQLCLTIQHLGSVGASRDIRVPVDGDGSADLRFDFGDTDTDGVELPDIDSGDEITIGIGE